MDLSPDSTLISSFRPDDFAEYLRLHGWSETEQARGPWRVFTNDRLDGEELVELVLPRKASSLEGRMHIASSINLLSHLNDESPEAVVQRILFRDHDVLQIRNLETEDDTSIELDMAVEQVASMKQLISYGACSEDTARPFFPRPQGRYYRRVTRHYRFGHTFRGSFGFTLTSRVEAPVVRFYQTTLFPDSDDEGELIVAPPERRVMERIVRGLTSTREAVQRQEPEFLAGQYPSGFNGNMCQALVEMSQEKDVPLEYRVIWSPRIQPSRDVERVERVELRRVEFASLETASQMMRKVAPEYKPVRGLVTELRASDNPASSESRRTVVILWTSKDIPGPSKVIVSLEPQDYRQALHAHDEWQIIEVSGLLQRFGNYWKLNEPRDFKVVG